MVDTQHVLEREQDADYKARHEEIMQQLKYLEDIRKGQLEANGATRTKIQQKAQAIQTKGADIYKRAQLKKM